MSQKQIIRRHLVQKGTLTAAQAIHQLGIYRVSARIHELRDEGMNIKTVMKPSSKPGAAGDYAVYTLIKE